MKESDLIPRLLLDLKRDEGLMLKPYKDTVGKLTIGYGRNLDDVGITKEEAEYLLANDVQSHINDVVARWPWIVDRPIKVRLAFFNMAFNLGVNRLAGFKQMIDAIYRDDYKAAANHALDSKWAQQVGRRALRIAQLYEEASL